MKITLVFTSILFLLVLVNSGEQFHNNLLIPKVADDASEDNDTLATSTPIYDGYFGAFAYEDDDWFSIVSDVNQGINIEILNLSAVEFFVEIYNITEDLVTTLNYDEIQSSNIIQAPSTTTYLRIYANQTYPSYFLMVNFVVNNPPSVTANSTTLEYLVGTTGHNIIWFLNDDDPATYVINNGSDDIDSGNWIDGQTILWNVDGLTMGTYNFTLTAWDTNSQSSFETIEVEVFNPIPSVTANSTTFEYTVGTTGHIIFWFLNDNDPATYIINNGSDDIDSGNWVDGQTISWNVDGLSVGTYNYTLTAWDTNSQSSFETIKVTVINPNPSVITNSTTYEYFEGTSGHIIYWFLNDNDPATYTINNGTVDVYSGNWVDGQTISWNIDGLLMGLYEYIMTAFDSAGQFSSKKITVQVNNPLPTVTADPSMIEYMEGTVGHIINWTLTDNDPTTYTINNGTIDVDSGNWIDGQIISWNLDGLSVGTYNFTLTAWDGDFQSSSKNITVVVTTNPTPVVTADPAMIEYMEGITGHFINWTLTDNDPTTYTINNGTVDVDSGNWIDGQIISWNVDGLSVGSYNFTLTAWDANSQSSSKNITVVVTTNPTPVVTADPAMIEYMEGITGHIINWTLTDNDPTTYTINNDTDVVDTGNWIDGQIISWNVDGLSVGSYNFTLIAWDGFGQSSSKIITVVVTTNSAPVVTADPTMIEYMEGTSGHFINWTVTDDDPTTYIINNGTLDVITGNWIDGQIISWNVDGLSVGTYNFTLIAWDGFGQSSSKQITVNVIESTIPVVNQDSSYFAYIVGTTGHMVNWTLYDNNPTTYVINNGTEDVDNGNWINGQTISWNVDGLPTGIFIFTLTAWDANSQSGYANITVEVVNPTPSITIENPTIEYLEGTTGHLINWTLTDNDPTTYTINNDTDAVDTGNWIDGQIISWNVDGLTEGTYNFTLTAWDGNGQSSSKVIAVIVITNPSPTISANPDITEYLEGTTGHLINWTLTDNDPTIYTINNGTLDVDSGNWIDGQIISWNVDGLTEGTYNFTLTAWDGNGQSSSKVIAVIVITNPTPIVTADPAMIEYMEGTSGHSINWTLNDNNPTNYTINNGTFDVHSGNWIDGQIVSYSVDGLSVGIYNFTLTAWDANSQSSSKIITVVIIANPSPIINIENSSLEYIYGTTGNIINWTLNDNDPATFIIKMNGNQITNETSWINGQIISWSVDGLNVGTYQFTLIAIDQAGHSSEVNIYVSVIDSTDTNIEDDNPFISGFPLGIFLMSGIGTLGIYLIRKSKK